MPREAADVNLRRMSMSPTKKRIVRTIETYSPGHHERRARSEFTPIRWRCTQNAEAQASRELPLVSPAGSPVSYDEHARVMFDLQTLADFVENIPDPDGHYRWSHHA